jgi:Flp pilus assembly protein TadD
LDAHPEGCDFLVVAAKARLRAGQDAEAAELSRRASGLCPEESAPYYYLGTLSARAGTVKEARRLFAEYMRTGGDAKRVPVAYR